MVRGERYGHPYSLRNGESRSCCGSGGNLVTSTTLGRVPKMWPLVPRNSLVEVGKKKTTWGLFGESWQC